MTKFYFLFAIVFIINLSACKKYDLAPGTPSCLKEKIKNFNKKGGSENAKMDEYEFQGKLVYVFNNGSEGPDNAFPVFDSNCNDIGLIGGMRGNTKINGEEFSNAIFKRTVWNAKD